MRHRSINRNSAVASGSSFFNGWRSTPGTTPLTSQLVLLISTTTTKVEIGSNAAKLRLRSLTCSTGQPPSVRMDDEGATTSAAPPHSFSPGAFPRRRSALVHNASLQNIEARLLPEGARRSPERPMPALMFVPQPASELVIDILVDQPEVSSGIEPGEVSAPPAKNEVKPRSLLS